MAYIYYHQKLYRKYNIIGLLCVKNRPNILKR